MTSTISTPNPAPFSLRLFDAEASPEYTDSPISPHITLTQFYARWYQPIVLASQKSVAKSTETIYRNALDWWSAITGDPPLRTIDEFTVAQFLVGLRTRTFRRGVVGAERKLSESSIAKHLRQIRAILFRAGPNIDAKRPSKGLMAVAPLVSVPRVESQPKGCFSIDQANAMAAAADRLAAPTLPHATPGQWWRAYLGWLYATGLRRFRNAG